MRLSGSTQIGWPYLLALPIGVMLHLVFDGAFGDDGVFWWPFSGGFDDAPLPVVARGRWSVVLELAGVGLAVWCVRRFGLRDPRRRQRFVRTGTLEDVVDDILRRCQVGGT